MLWGNEAAWQVFGGVWPPFRPSPSARAGLAPSSPRVRMELFSLGAAPKGESADAATPEAEPQGTLSLFGQSSALMRQRQGRAGPASKYFAPEDLLTELMSERQRAMVLSRDATYDDFQRRLEMRRNQGVMESDLEQWLTLRENRLRLELEEVATNLSQQTRERRAREEAQRRERERQKKAGLAATRAELEAAARRRLASEARAKAHASALVAEERRRLGLDELRRRVLDRRKQESARKDSHAYFEARKESNVASAKRARAFARATEEAKRKAQLADARARMKDIEDERKVWMATRMPRTRTTTSAHSHHCRATAQRSRVDAWHRACIPWLARRPRRAARRSGRRRSGAPSRA